MVETVGMAETGIGTESVIKTETTAEIKTDVASTIRELTTGITASATTVMRILLGTETTIGTMIIGEKRATEASDTELIKP